MVVEVSNIRQRNFTLMCVLCSLMISAITASPSQFTMASSASTVPKKSWRELSDPTDLLPANGSRYYSFTLSNGTTAHLVVSYIKSGKWRVRPNLAASTNTTSSVAALEKASAGINGGFFNLSNGLSASYLVLDGKTVADPHDNKALIENPKLAPFLEQIYNRSELRSLRSLSNKNSKELTYEIVPHNAPVPAGSVIVDSIQAGPQLLPTLRSEEEAFIRKNVDGTSTDSIGCQKPAARSAVGFTPDGYFLILAVSGKGQDPESTGITLEELADLMRRLGCRQALNLDGGSSTTLFLRLANKENSSGASVCGKQPETLVKSTVLLFPQ